MRLPLIEFFDESTCLFFYHHDEILLWSVFIDLLNIWKTKVPPELFQLNLWDISEPYFDQDRKQYELTFRWCGKIVLDGDTARINLNYYGIDAQVLEWFIPLKEKYIFGETW